MKRANPSNIFQEDEDGTRCNRHVWQLSLAQLALDANTGAGGGSLGYFAHASEKFTEARLSQTLQNVRIGGFVPPFFFVHYPYLSLQATFQRTCCLPAGTHLASSSLILFPSLSLLFNSPFLTPNLDIKVCRCRHHIINFHTYLSYGCAPRGKHGCVRGVQTILLDLNPIENDILRQLQEAHVSAVMQMCLVACHRKLQEATEARTTLLE